MAVVLQTGGRKWDTGDVARVARNLYRKAPLQARVLQALRPYICPFDELMGFLPSAGSVLDVGCGAGLFLGLTGTAQPGLCAYGFDADSDAIRAARAMAATNFPDGRISFHQADAGAPWPDFNAEVVSMIDVLHHIPSGIQRSVIADAFAHVKPGGIFLYKDMAERPLLRAWWNRLHDLVMARQWIHYRSINEVERWLLEMGAQIVEKRAKNLGPYGHEFVVAKRLA